MGRRLSCWFLDTGPLARAQSVVREFKVQQLDFAMGTATLRRLCPALDTPAAGAAELIVETLSFTPRLMLMNSMSFLLLLVTLSDAQDEVGALGVAS